MKSLPKQKIPDFDKKITWEKIEADIKKRQLKILTLSFLFISLFSISFLVKKESAYLYNESKFKDIIALEKSLEAKLSLFKVEAKEIKDERLLALYERLSLLNERIERVKIELAENPLNPNYHKVYLACLRTKRKLIQTLEQKGA